jgi:hypothetical protein
MTPEQITEMKKLAILSKRYSDFHMKNLSYWPHMIFSNLDKVEIDYAIGDKPDECHIHYTLFPKKGKIIKVTKALKKKIPYLEQWVKSMLWNEIDFSIKDGGYNKIYPFKEENE